MRTYDFSSPLLMAIVNLTPDSFFADSRIPNNDEALVDRLRQCLTEGADIIDIGGCSTRPNSIQPTAEEEWKRIQPALNTIRNEHINLPISLDTYRADIAKKACEQYNIDIINDISGGNEDIYLIAATYGAAYVLTHNGAFQTMEEVVDFFQKRVDQLNRIGVHDIFLDPGLGFGKDIQQNYQLLRYLPWIKKMFGLPILVGLSRKRMIYQLLESTPKDALAGTIAANTLALCAGADILRVHDVKAAKDTIRIYQQYNFAL